MSQENKSTTPQSSAQADYQKKIKELEAQLAARNKDVEQLTKDKESAEGDILKAVCDRVGVNPQDLLAMDAATKAQEDTLEYDIGRQVVTINGFPFTGRGKAKRGVVEVIVSMAANQRNERMRQLVGTNHEVELLSSGGVRTRTTGQVDGGLV